ncbi:MAG TPA: sulfurtransferase TusA family protein, partial [Candidatus Bathyarchaeia archaeon]
NPRQVLRLTATDPGSVRDVPAWASKTGNKVLEASEDSGVFTFLIEVS